jgi:hypothetical protein
MDKKLALVNKIKRRRKKIRSDASSFDRINKIDLIEETMANSQKAYSLMRKVARRSDRNFGVDTINHEPQISKRNEVLTVERFDYDPGMGTDFGIRLTMAAGLIGNIGVRPNDIVLILEGDLKGRYLKVVEVTDSTHLRLEDVASYVGPESNIVCRFLISDVKASYT